MKAIRAPPDRLPKRILIGINLRTKNRPTTIIVIAIPQLL